MSKTLPALIVDGQFLGYFPPSNASEIAYDSNTTVKQKIDTKADTSDIPTDFVSAANGGTFGGNVTISKSGNSELLLGNSGDGVGVLRIYSDTQYRAVLTAPGLTAGRAFDFPDKGGTIALMSDIVNISKVVNSNDTSVLNIQLNPTNENIIHCLLISNLWNNTLAGCYVGIIQIRKNNNSCAILDLIPTPNTYVKPVPTYDNTTDVLTLTFDNATARFLTLFYG